MNKEILIISQDDLELTTELVMDWIYKLGGKAIRFNGDNLFEEHAHIRITSNSLEINGIDRVGKYYSVWNRRWGTIDLHKEEKPTSSNNINNSSFGDKIRYLLLGLHYTNV